MENLILDTSVLVKLFSLDERDSIADNLLEKFSLNKLNLFTLDLAIYELANTLKLSKKVPVSVVFANILVVFKMKKIILVSEEIVKNSLILMDKYRLTAYDAAFVVTAELEKIPLLTADYKHHQKSISKNILHYKDFSLA